MPLSPSSDKHGGNVNALPTVTGVNTAWPTAHVAAPLRLLMSQVLFVPPVLSIPQASSMSRGIVARALLTSPSSILLST